MAKQATNEELFFSGFLTYFGLLKALGTPAPNEKFLKNNTQSIWIKI